jgi:hypothetical protein
MTSRVEPQNPLRSTARLRGWLPAIFVSLLISLVIISPFFWRGSATGHDFQFHASSWLDAAGQWKEGVIFPRWTEWADYGYGEPRFIFYPPFSWMLGAALGSLLPWNAVPAVFVLLVESFAGISAFLLARRVLSERAALFCIACYAANPYALVVIYIRSDFAELLADAFFPLLLLLTLQICEMVETAAETNSPKPAPHGTIAAFGAGFAAIWLSNAPAGVIASYSVAAVLGFAALARRSWKPLTRGAAGLALGFGLTCFYLLPAAYEQRWVNITQALSTGLLPSENFLFTVINNPEHTLFNWIASSLAVLMIILAGAAALAARGRSPIAGTAEMKEWRIFVLLAALATLLMLRLSAPFWLLLPKLRFVQFPWRWMSVLALPFAIFLACAMARKRWGWIWMLTTFAILGSTGALLVQKGWWDTEDIPGLRRAIANGQGFEGTDEYDPLGDDHTNIPAKSPEVQVMDTDSMQGPAIKPIVHVDRWSPEEKEVSVSSRQPFFLGLRILNYPAWRVELNGAKVTPLSGDDYDQMIVQVPTGESHIHVRFTRTRDRTLGGLLSLVSALVLLLLLVTGIRGNHKSLETHLGSAPLR